MAKIRLQVSETSNLEFNLRFGWWQQLKALDISPVFRVIGWLFVCALGFAPFWMFAEWGAARPESQQLFNLALLGGAGLLLLIAWLALGKFQHFADPPMFLGILIFALAQIAILLANATTGAANQLNTFGGPGSKLFSGVAVMSFVAIFYTAVVVLNTARKRRLIGLVLLLTLLTVSVFTIMNVETPAYVSGFLVIAAWLVSTAVILGGYRRILLVGGIFTFVISTFLLLFGNTEHLALPITTAISFVYAGLQTRKSMSSLRAGWKQLWADFRSFIRGQFTWADLSTAHKARLWLVVSLILLVVTVVVMASPAKGVPATAGTVVTNWELAQTDIESFTSEFGRISTNLSALGKLFFGNGFGSTQATGNITTIFAATGLVGLASYLILAASGILLAVRQWWQRPYASWAGMWWPVLLVGPVYLLFYKIDFTALLIWWAMFAHLSAIEHWEKQGKVYRLWSLLNLRGRQYGKSFVIAQIAVLVLLGLVLFSVVGNLNDLFLRQVI